MTKTKILIASVSPHGSTAGVARAIAGVLQAAGAQVTLSDLSQNPDPRGFDRVILGGPIRYDRWHRPARDYVQRHREALSQKPLAAFFTCLTLSQDSAAARNQAGDYARHVAMSLPGGDPAQVGQFAGALDYSKFGVPQRWLARAILRLLGAQQGDFRDWQAVDQWAAGQAEALPFTSERMAA